MIDNNGDISVTRLDTGDIAYIRYEQKDDCPRLADRLRATAYNEEEALLDKIVDASQRAHTALQDTFNGLQEWNQVEGRKAFNERMARQTQQSNGQAGTRDYDRRD